MRGTITEHCVASGPRMTGQRRVIARGLDMSGDSPDIAALRARIADRPGYRPAGHRPELCAVPRKDRE